MPSPTRALSAYRRNILRNLRACWDYITKDNLDGTYRVQDSCVATASLAALAVTEGKIGAGAVTVDKIGDSAVTEGKIAAGAVTAAKTRWSHNGVNMLPRKWADFECMPTLYDTSASEIKDEGVLFGQSLYLIEYDEIRLIEADTSNERNYLSFRAARWYLLSFYAVAEDEARVAFAFLEDGDWQLPRWGDYVDLVAGQPRRYHCGVIFECTESFTGCLALIADPNGEVVFIDNIMIEEVPVGVTEPSKFDPGNWTDFRLATGKLFTVGAETISEADIQAWKA